MEDEIAPAPQSIVIQAGTPAPTEIATAPPEQVEAQTEGPTPTATSASGVSKEAVETYITVMNVKDNSNGTAVLAAIFLFFIPLLFGISFLENFDDGGSCFLCLGSMGIGTVFAIMSVTESSKNQQNQKMQNYALLRRLDFTLRLLQRYLSTSAVPLSLFWFSLVSSQMHFTMMDLKLSMA